MILDDYPSQACPLLEAADETHHSASPTAVLLDELALFGYRPHADEPDPRPLPTPDQASQEIGNAFEALSTLMADTRLEDGLGDLLWSLVNIFHRKIASLDRSLDDNEQAQRRKQNERAPTRDRIQGAAEHSGKTQEDGRMAGQGVHVYHDRVPCTRRLMS
jgi:hypothetical protein